jgi:two-component system, OmpR family, response regulator
MRIVVIEDERTLAGFSEQSLRAAGHAISVCHDGESGEAAALSGDFELVLLDPTLPGKDGLDVLGSIRTRTPDLPVIVLTARAAVEQRDEGLDRGANDYMTKPFSVEELLARVRTQLPHPLSTRPPCSRSPGSTWICAPAVSNTTDTRST